MIFVRVHAAPVSGARALYQWVLMMPMLFMAGLLTALASIVTLPIAVSIVATRRVPQRLAVFQVWVLRERVRTFSGLFLLRRDAPPWPRHMVATDPGDDPRVAVTAELPSTLPRVAPLTHSAVSVVHLIVLVPVAVVLDLLYPVWILLAARRGWSSTTARRLVEIETWTAEVLAYAWLVSSQRPRWRLRVLGPAGSAQPSAASARAVDRLPDLTTGLR